MSQGEDLPKNILRVGVIGCGVGKVHVANLQALPHLFQVVIVCDLEADKARQVADQYRLPSWTTDFEAVCRRADIDIVDICTPPYQHFDQIMTALAAGKHVICEKPLVGSLQEVDLLAEAERAHNRRIMPILQYRFGHGLQKLKWLVDQGLTGQAFLSTVEVAWRRGPEYYHAPWRGKWETELGGTLLNHAIHHLDMLCTVVGPVRSVFARASSLVNPVEVEDCASISLEMADGSLASLSATLGSVEEISRHRFCFRNLTAESNTRPYSNSDDPWKITGANESIDRQINAALAAFTPGLAGFQQQFQRYHAALVGESPLPVSLEDARALMEIMTAIYASAQTALPVSLPIPADHDRYKGWAPLREERL